MRSQVTSALAGDPPASVEWTLARTDHEDADTEEAASCRLRLSVRDPDRDKVGKAFTAPLVELALASYAGLHAHRPARARHPVRRLPARLRPPRAPSTEQVVLHDGTTLDLPATRLPPPTRHMCSRIRGVSAQK